jgi:hypothetical protein
VSDLRGVWVSLTLAPSYDAAAADVVGVRARRTGTEFSGKKA